MAKITDEQLRKLNSIKQDALEVASTLGELTYQKINLDLEIEKEKLKIVDIKARESRIFEELNSIYGNVSINTETGEIS
jgi:hypothetical protein